MLNPGVWDGFDPALMTLASPDPQAFRPPDQPKNVLQVGLPTNFKAARFDAEEPTALLRELESDIEQARLGPGTVRWKFRSSSKCTSRFSCRSPNGRC